MRSRAVRALGLIGFGLGPTILFAGCGEDESGARRTLTSIQPSSYVVRPPATTEPAEPEDAEPEIDDEGRTSRSQEYTVQAGDAVYSIANRFGISAEDLAAFNDWPNVNQPINPGDVIGIPDGALVPDAATGDDEGEGGGGDDPETTEETTDADGTEPTETTPPGTEGECVEGTHTIADGDIPTRVANQYDVTVEQLEAANAGNPAYQNFWIGEDITIPCD